MILMPAGADDVRQVGNDRESRDGVKVALLLKPRLYRGGGIGRSLCSAKLGSSVEQTHTKETRLVFW